MVAHLEYERADPQWRDFVRVLERDGRDVDGKLLKCGSTVLCHPSAPESFREDSLENRQEFLRLDRTWSSAARLRVWFPALSVLPAEVAKRAEQSRAVKNAFLAAIDEKARGAILALNMKEVPVAGDVSLADIAAKAEGLADTIVQRRVEQQRLKPIQAWFRPMVHVHGKSSRVPASSLTSSTNYT
jgi:hypothetical protein